jgi:hypothetical protein
MIVISGRRGQLGNRLFAFANVGAFGVTRGTRVANPGFREYAGWFVGTSRDGMPTFPSRGLARRLPAGMAYSLVRILDSVNRRVNWVPGRSLDDTETVDFDADRELAERYAGARLAIVDGLYLLARRDFVRHAEDIRRFFAPTPAVADGARRRLDAARRPVEVLVGVHIRQGDYLEQKPNLYYPTSDYVELMMRVRALFGGRSVGFLVCSDSAQADEAFGDLAVLRGPGHPAQDLYALAGCDYIVGPPSTFSEWASFYGRVPRFVFRKGMGHPAALPRLSDFTVHHHGYGRHSEGYRPAEPLEPPA